MARKETGGFFMEMEGRERVVLVGCRGIVDYSEDHVTLRTPFVSVTVYGQDLEMGCMTVEGATVVGTFQRIELQ